MLSTQDICFVIPYSLPLTPSVILKAVTDSDLAELMRNPQLPVHRVASNKRGDAFLAAVAKHRRQVTEIDLSGCVGITDAGLANLIENCPQLKPDEITLSARVEGELYLKMVADRHPDMIAVALSQCTNVKDSTLAVLIEKCPSLDAGQIRLPSRGDLFCQAVGQYRQNLTEIDLRECDAVTDHGLSALMQGCSQLLPDKISSTAKGDLFCAAVASLHPDLSTIDLSACEAVTDKGVILLAQHCPGLTKINLSGCFKVTESALSACVTNCRQLHPNKLIFPPVHSILPGVHVDMPLSILAGWTKHFEKPFEHRTKAADLDPGCGRYLMVAAQKEGSDRLALCAMGSRTAVLQKTSTVADSKKSNGVLWHNCHGKSFGFSPASENEKEVGADDNGDNSGIDVEQKDSEMQDNQDSLRLSWRLDGNGGERVGGITFANDCDSTGYTKLIYYSDGAIKGKGEAFLAAVAESHQDITEIDLLGYKTVTDASLASLMEKCPHLHPDKVLSRKKGPLFVAAVAAYHSEVTEICLSGCDDVTDASLAVLLQKCANLHPDSVTASSKGPAFVAAIAEHRPDLTKINLCECKGMAHTELVELVKSCVQLHPDDLLSEAKDCDFFAGIIDHRPDLTKIDLTCLEKVSFIWGNILVVLKVSCWSRLLCLPDLSSCTAVHAQCQTTWKQIFP